MKKLSLAVLLGIALSAMLSGCNQNESTPPATPPASTNGMSTNGMSTNAP
jgi:nitrous oxide reductase accessory protein NosL